jgi:hypothetical protein
MITLNIGNLDRALRILVGITLITLAATGALGAWAYLGFIPLATGALAWCPLYRLLGIRTTAR